MTKAKGVTGRRVRQPPAFRAVVLPFLSRAAGVAAAAAVAAGVAAPAMNSASAGMGAAASGMSTAAAGMDTAAPPMSPAAVGVDAAAAGALSFVAVALIPAAPGIEEIHREKLPAAPDPRFELTRVLHQDDFQHGLSDWVIESERPAHVKATAGVLDVDTPAGLTLWFRPELQGPILIEFEASAESGGGANDRVCEL